MKLSKLTPNQESQESGVCSCLPWTFLQDVACPLRAWKLLCSLKDFYLQMV
jgi:hypothetical protein